MKYFIDTEFLEGKQSKLIGKTKPTIDLISIGIVAEDGREYYAISKEFNVKEAWNRFQWEEHKSIHKVDEDKKLNRKVYWLRDNILKPIFNEWNKYGYHSFTYKNMKYCIKSIGKTNKQIANEIKHFVANRPIEANKEQWILDYDTKDVQFYGYYADYDWVVFCWLFGKMIDLPNGFPMYCIDLKQTLDEKITSGCVVKHRYAAFSERDISMDRGNTFDEVLRIIKEQPNYPKQTNEHNALADAKWNYELYKFLQTL